MAIVPRTTQRQVLPDASQVRAPVGDIVSSSTITGRALRGVGEEIEHSMDNLVKAQEIIQQREEERVQTHITADYKRYLNSAAYGDGTQDHPGFLNLQGTNAVDGVKTAVEGLQSYKMTLLEDPTIAKQTPRFREMLDVSLQAMADETTAQFSNHSYDQKIKADVAAIDSRVEAFTQSAILNYGDKEAFANSMAVLNMDMQKKAKLLGWNADTLKEAMRENTGAVVVGVIDGALANEATGKANALLKQYREYIPADKRADAIREIRRINDKHEAEMADLAKDIIYVAGEGKTHPMEEQALAQFKGTKWEAAIKTAVEGRQFMNEYKSLPVDAQAYYLSQVQQMQNMTPEGVHRMKNMEKVHNDMVATIDRGDGLLLAQEQGIVQPVVPLNFNDPETFAAGMQQRKQDAAIATQRYGRYVSPLTSQDAKQFKQFLDDGNLPPEGLQAFLTQFNTVMGSQADDMMAQMYNEKRPDLSASLLSGDARVTSSIITGGRLRKDAGKNLQLGIEDQRKSISKVFKNVFTNEDGTPIVDSAVQDALIEAANSNYASKKVPSGQFEYDETTWIKSYQEVVGGTIEFKDTPYLPKPHPSIQDEDDLQEYMNAMNTAEVAKYSATPGSIPMMADQPFPVDRFGELDLKWVGKGVYELYHTRSGKLLTDSVTGQAFVLRLSDLIQENPLHVPGSLPTNIHSGSDFNFDFTQ